MKRSASFALLGILFLLSIGLASAIDLSITEKEISSVAIIELNKPALFELEITNNEPDSSTFEIYSLVGIKLEPSEEITLAGNETRKIVLKVYPRQVPGYFSFEYKLKDSQRDIQTDGLAVNIVKLKDAFNFYAEDINPSSEKAIVHFDNKAGFPIESIKADINSVFFSAEEEFSLQANEKKQFEFDLDKDKTRELLAGPYIFTAKIKVDGKTAELSNLIRFTEQEGMKTTETSEGFLLRRHEILKENRGNLNADIEVVVKKNLIESIVTTFSVVPTNEDRVGFNVFYIFQKTLAPGESWQLITRTNWWLAIFVVGGIILIIYLVQNHFSNKLRIIKKVSFVKTKGGEFALKVILVLKAREFIQKIKVVDRLPSMVKIYERYGTIAPDRIDEKNRRVEWDVENLNPREERVFSYIIYSKIGVVGRFELPEAEAIYEHKDKLKEITSNRAFFINEPNQKRPVVMRAPLPPANHSSHHNSNYNQSHNSNHN